MDRVHGTCIAFDGRGVLLRGAPGSGKSDLALRAIADGARLVADDQVLLALKAGRIVASAPPRLFGMIEIRGLGIVRIEAESEAEIAMIVDLAPSSAIERLPERRVATLLGVELPCIAVAPFEASAATKLRFALSAVVERGQLLP